MCRNLLRLVGHDAFLFETWPKLQYAGWYVTIFHLSRTFFLCLIQEHARGYRHNSARPTSFFWIVRRLWV
jgi:hypothetical protein